MDGWIQNNTDTLLLIPDHRARGGRGSVDAAFLIYVCEHIKIYDQRNRQGVC